MGSEETVKVDVVIDPNTVTLPCSSSFTADELCILLCKKYGIPPLIRTLFALRIKGSDYYLKDNSKVLKNSREYELRIRFKVPKLEHLKTLDEKTFDYYFQQARNDVYFNKVPEIIYPDHRREIFGLGITDMYRAVLEEKLPINEVKKNFKKHIPKLIMKRHGPFAKKQVYDTLPNMCAKNHDCGFVKNAYIQQLNFLAPNYLSEEYKNVIWKNGEESINVNLHVAPFHKDQPGIRLYHVNKGEWTLVSTIEELVYFIRNADNCLEISRRGTPLFFQFESEVQLSSFISVCDGYYRLMIKWTFNLSKDDETPSLKELQRIKCHGPVGGAFSYRKLEEKRGKKYGCYIIRQCQDEYNIFFIDVCTKNNTTETYRLEFKGNCYILNNEKYLSIEDIVSCHQHPEGRIYLNECLPPSEYDKSQLLLCGEPQKIGFRIDQTELQEILKDNKSPRCLSAKDIILYARSMKVGSGGITATHKAHWKLDQTRKLEVAYKTLQDNKVNGHLKDFIELANKWACVQSSSIVRLYGITLNSPTAMVLEYLPYGPFDDFLRTKEKTITILHLKKVAASLTRALWDLSEAGIVHGYIRCRRLLVASADSERIVVKLSGPSLHQYTSEDVHWMPVEFMSDMSLAKRSVAGDIWAFATTIWEIFSFGQKPTEINPIRTAKSYEMGERLHKPERCPSEIWALVRQSWQHDPHLRPRPQGLMRDINHMLHAEYIPVHIYEEPKISLNTIDNEETVSSTMFLPTEILSDVASNKSLISSVNSSIPSMNGTSISDQYDNHIFSERLGSSESLSAFMFSHPPSSRMLPPAGASPRPSSPQDHDEFHKPHVMENIVSQGKTYNVTLTSFKLGCGYYGRVFRGIMERESKAAESREVAVKILSRSPDNNDSFFDDFKNEFEIMKSLQHPNIIEILGYSMDECGTDVRIYMEYMEQGSLNNYLKFTKELTISHLLKYCLDIATGMDHISAKNIIHRDLATRNILVQNIHHVKITDFGLARVMPKEEDSYKVRSKNKALPMNWSAPEAAVKPFHFSTKSDVWSYGVTVWEIFTRSLVDVPPFDIDRPAERASSFQIPDECPSEVYRYLMKDCWDLSPAKRPSFIDLVHKCKGLIPDYK